MSKFLNFCLQNISPENFEAKLFLMQSVLRSILLTQNKVFIPGLALNITNRITSEDFLYFLHLK